MAHKMNQPNEGIICEVSHCVYNTEGRNCLADKIMVTPRHAKTADETDCSTFEAR